MITEATVRQLDAADSLAPLRRHFHVPDNLIYLDGNSLGLMPRRVRERMRTVIDGEWAEGLIRSWGARWFSLPNSVGDKIAPLLGAGPGQTVVGDSTSINLFKCLGAAVILRPERRVIVSEADNFPTDNYMVEGIAGLRGDCQVRHVPLGADPRDFIDESVAAVLLTHVNYRTAEIHDMNAITAAARAAGAVMIWDLSHSVGALPLDLPGAGVDFAVGCTYKYLNGGPGAPAFTYVAPHLIGQVRQPLSGWMGHRRPFAFDLGYEPGETIRRFVCGTPQVLSLAALDESLEVWAGIDMAAVRRKSQALTGLFIDLLDQDCAGLGLHVVSPRSDRRASHVSVACDNGLAVMRALADNGVIGDFRAPNLMRFGFAPLYCSFEETYAAVQKLRAVLTGGQWRAAKYSTPVTVT